MWPHVFPCDRATCDTLEVPNRDSFICSSLDSTERLQVYIGITLFTVFINFSRTIGFVYLCVTASQHLHNRMFKALLRSPVLFFDNNPVGK